MEIVKNFGRLVWLVIYVFAILICSLARMGHPWNVFEVCTSQIGGSGDLQLINFLNIAPLIPAACRAIAPEELRYDRMLLFSAMEV